RVLDVVKTPRDHQVFVDNFGLAKSQHLGRSGRVCPALEIHVSRLDGDFEGKVALADHLKDARIAQVVPQRLVELLREVYQSRRSEERRVGKECKSAWSR